MTDRKAILLYLDDNGDEYGRRLISPDYLVFDEIVMKAGHADILFEPAVPFVERAGLNTGGHWPKHVYFCIEFKPFVTTSFRQHVLATKLDAALPQLARRLGVERIVYRAKDVSVSPTVAVLNFFMFDSPPNADLRVLASENLTAQQVIAMASAIGDTLQTAADHTLALESGVESSPPQYNQPPEV